MTQTGSNSHLENQRAGLDSIEEYKAALQAASREIEELRDKYLRAAAEVDNTRKRVERDLQARATEKQRDFLRRLLEVFDNLERVLANPSGPTETYQGVQMTLRQFENVLQSAGAERLPVRPGEPFDPKIHEAVEVRAGDVYEPSVYAVLQSGWQHEGALLRPARVVVMQ